MLPRASGLCPHRCPRGVHLLVASTSGRTWAPSARPGWLLGPVLTFTLKKKGDYIAVHYLQPLVSGAALFAVFHCPLPLAVWPQVVVVVEEVRPAHDPAEERSQACGVVAHGTASLLQCEPHVFWIEWQLVVPTSLSWRRRALSSRNGMSSRCHCVE